MVEKKPDARAPAQKPPGALDFRPLPKCINGGLAGMIGVSAVYPLDLVKTRLQNQQIGPSGERQYNNMWDCFKKTYRAEGYFGMYRGSAVNIALVTPEKGIKLAVNDLFRYWLATPDGKVTVPKQMFAGIFVGLAQVTISCPMDLLKIQLQDAGRIAAQAKKEGRKIKRITALGVARKLVRERGFAGLYRGLAPTIARETWFSVVYFPIFFETNELYFDENGHAPFWWSFCCGFFAGACAAIAVHPIDVVKTRQQTLTKGKNERAYSGMLDCFLKMYKYEGWTAFLKGLECRIIIIAPLFGIAQTVYYIGVGEAVVHFLGLD